MADIFISYSQKDRYHVELLSSFLEAAGFTTWWDRSLQAGDQYRDTISTELNSARLVIVVWTQNSITSSFVRAEASRAAAEDKLIPVKTRDVGYHDLPLPFGEFHTEDFGNRERIKQRVLEEIARPSKRPNLWKAFCYEGLSWLGVAGAAVSLMSNAQGLLNLSRLSRYIVQYWTTLLTAFWGRLLFFLPRVVEVDALMLSVITFTAATLFLAPVEQKPRRQRSNIWLTSALFALILLMFSAGTLASFQQAGFFYSATFHVLAGFGIDLALLPLRNQAILVLSFVLVLLALLMLAIIFGSSFIYRVEETTHQASVRGTSLRLHRIILVVIALGLLNELSSVLEKWLRDG